MPNDDIVDEFCKLFQVDFMKGKGEFVRAHLIYKERCDRKRKVSASVGGKQTQTVPEVKKVNTEDVVLEMLYGKIPYVDFKILTGQLMSGADILECVYGKVGFDTFLKIVKVVKT